METRGQNRALDESRVQRAMLVALAVAVLAAAAWAIANRSPWYDEYYTLYITRADAPFPALWAGWLRDNHPPTFYALSWALSRALDWATGGLGNEVEPRRLLNLLLGAGAGLALLRIARARADLRPVFLAYAMGLAGAAPLIVRVAELRSNFLALAAGAVAVAALAAFAAPGAPIRRRAAVPVLAGALGLAFAIHIAATIIVGALALAFGLRMILAGDGRGTGRLALAGLIGALPFAACMAVQLGTIAGNTRAFWIPGGFPVARWTIEMELIAGLRANPPFALAGLAGLAVLGWRDLRAKTLSEPLALALTLGAGLVLAIALLVALHLQRPFVIARYLVCLHPALAMILAIGIAALAGALRPRPRLALYLAITAGALTSLGRQALHVASLPGWDGTATALAREVRACPHAVVHAATGWNSAVLDLPPADNRMVVPFAYRVVAARHGFPLAPPRSRAMAQGCPTLFWAEHVAGQAVDATGIAAGLRAQGYPVRSGTLRRIGDGWIFAAR